MKRKEKKEHFSNFFCFKCRNENLLTSEWIPNAGNKINGNNLFSFCLACVMKKRDHISFYMTTIKNS